MCYHSFPKPNITWLYSDERITQSDKKIALFPIFGTTRSVSYEVLENGSLHILNPYNKLAVPHESFTCEASSPLGTVNLTYNFNIGMMSKSKVFNQQKHRRFIFMSRLPCWLSNTIEYFVIVGNSRLRRVTFFDNSLEAGCNPRIANLT